jgi:hypothetical protein
MPQYRYPNLAAEMNRLGVKNTEMATLMKKMSPAAFRNKLRGKTGFTLAEALEIQGIIAIKAGQGRLPIDYLFRLQ